MKPLLLAAVFATASSSLAAAQELSGEWTISSSVGTTPITVHCTLLQRGDDLNGLCAPADGKNGPLFQGTVNGSHASWGYDVTFRGRPAHVGFVADMDGDQAMKGVLTLSGKPSPFTAAKDR